jgi:alanine racemase
MVRSGFLLYGYTENNIGNKPILSIYSHVISKQAMKRGDKIGYDRTYEVTKSTNIVVVPIGYADGFNRRLSSNFQIIINNKKYPIVGRICMDVFMVDVGKDNVNIGDRVVILGKSGKESILLDDYAEKIGTSPYEVLSTFNYRRMNYITQNK